MQRTARGLDYRVRFVVPDLQPIDELQPTSCTWKCLAAEALGGHSAVCRAYCCTRSQLASATGARVERRERVSETKEAFVHVTRAICKRSPRVLATCQP